MEAASTKVSDVLELPMDGVRGASDSSSDVSSIASGTDRFSESSRS